MRPIGERCTNEEISLVKIDRDNAGLAWITEV